MEIFVTVKRNLARFGMVDPIDPSMRLARPIICLFILYSVVVSGMCFVCLEAKSFEEQAESILPCLVELTVCSTYTVIFMQRRHFFALFQRMESIIQERK